MLSVDLIQEIVADVSVIFETVIVPGAVGASVSPPQSALGSIIANTGVLAQLEPDEIIQLHRAGNEKFEALPFVAPVNLIILWSPWNEE